jgi:hypothetical protein
MIKARISTSSLQLTAKTHSVDVPVDSETITPIYFSLENESGEPIPTTSNVYLINSNDTVITPLVSDGNYWRLDAGSTSFGLGDVELNTTTRKQMRIVVEQLISSVYRRDTTEEFTLALKRYSAFSLVGLSDYFTWISPYTSLDQEVTTQIQTLADLSLSGNQLSSASAGASPVFTKYDYNFPFYEYNDSDKSSSNLDVPVSEDFDLYAVVNLRALATGPLTFVTIGTGGNAIKISLESGAIAASGLSGLVVTDGTVSTGQSLLIRLSYDAGTHDLAMQINNDTAVTDTGGSAYAAGKLVLGDNGTDTHAVVGFGDVIMFNSIQGSTNNTKIANALAAKYNITLA